MADDGEPKNEKVAEKKEEGKKLKNTKTVKKKKDGGKRRTSDDDKKKMKDFVQTNRFFVIMAILSAAFAVYLHFENRYAIKAEINKQMRLVEIRLEIKITEDQLKDTEERMTVLNSRLKKNRSNITAKEGVVSLKSKIKSYDRKLDILYESLLTKKINDPKIE